MLRVTVLTPVLMMSVLMTELMLALTQVTAFVALSEFLKVALIAPLIAESLVGLQTGLTQDETIAFGAFETSGDSHLRAFVKALQQLGRTLPRESSLSEARAANLGHSNMVENAIVTC